MLSSMALNGVSEKSNIHTWGPVPAALRDFFVKKVVQNACISLLSKWYMLRLLSISQWFYLI